MPSSPTNFYYLRPKLEEILDDAAPFPYTLRAFMDFLSHNHCLETVEYIMEVKRYRKTYNMVQQILGDSASGNAWRTHMMVQWQHLMTTYIIPAAPREINISPAILAELLDFANVLPPPPPDLLEASVQSMHQLINDSVLEPFFKELSRERRTLSLSKPSLFSAWIIWPIENFKNRKTKRSSTKNKLGKSPE
jgi:hypothetical protein